LTPSATRSPGWTITWACAARPATTFLVGGTTAVAGALAIARHRLAPWASWIAALALTTWLAVQVRDIPFHPMQVAIGAAAIAIVALAAHARWA
jgi:uncharacterized membrane protein (DUF2068 family)